MYFVRYGLFVVSLCTAFFMKKMIRFEFESVREISKTKIFRMTTHNETFYKLLFIVLIRNMYNVMVINVQCVADIHICNIQQIRIYFGLTSSFCTMY